MELTPVEQRVVGCLIEKERATPQQYPLTLNSLRLACNQSSNREPVMDLDDHEVDEALASLREQGLTRIVYSPSNRASKYRHVLDEKLHLGPEELAVLAVLLLRGPQTIGEIKGRTERLFPFADLDAVQVTLGRLVERFEATYVERLERRPGQKDARWAHRLGAVEATSSGSRGNDGSVDPRTPTNVASGEDQVPSEERHIRSSGPRTLDPYKYTTDFVSDEDEWNSEPGEPMDEPSVTGSMPAASDPGTQAQLDELARLIDQLGGEVAELRAELATFRAQFD